MVSSAPEDSLIDEPLLSPGFTCRVERPIDELLDLEESSQLGSSPSYSALRRRYNLGGGLDSSMYDEDDDTKKSPSFSRLLALALPDYHWLGLGLLSLVARLPFSLAAPHFMSTSIGSCIDRDTTRLWTSLEFFAAAGALNAALDFWNVFLFTFVQNRIVRRLRSRLFSQILSQEIGYFDQNSSGTISSRLTSDCTEIASDLSWVFRNITEAVVRVGGIAVYLCVQNLRLGLLACAIIPFTAAANRVYGEWMTKNASAVQDALANANHVAQEAIASVRTVASFANEGYESRRYDRALKRWYRLCNRQAVVTGLYFALIYSFLSQLLVPTALLVYGSYLVFHGMHPEKLIAFMLYQGQLQEYVNNLLNAFTSMYKSSGAAASVFDLMDRTPIQRVVRRGQS